MKFTRMFDRPVSIKESGYEIVIEEERHIDLQLAVDCIRANGENYLDNIIGGIYDMPIICNAVNNAIELVSIA